MDLIERYLHAVESWLPRKERRDVVAEISEDLHSEIDEREAGLGRTLNEADVEALLKQRGRPVLVANRYWPQRSLIGPVWFPTYVLVLRIVGLCYVVPWVVVVVAISRMQNPALTWGRTLLGAWGTLWNVSFTTAGVVTLIFAVLQWTETRTHFLEQWEPRKLPRVRDPHRISRGNSIVEVGMGVLFVLWWIGYVSSPVLFDGPTFRLVLAPVRVYFFWGYLLVALFNIGLAIRNLQRPYWTGLRAMLRLLSDLAGGTLFCWLMTQNIIASLVIANVSAGQTLEIRDSVHAWMVRCLPLAVIIAVIAVTVDLFRIVRVHREGRVALEAARA